MNPAQVRKKLELVSTLQIPYNQRALEEAFLRLARDARRYRLLRKEDHDTEVCIRNFERMGGAFENLTGVALDRKLDSMYATKLKEAKSKPQPKPKGK